MKFWVTKHALTSGIEEVEADDPEGTDHKNMICVEHPDSFVGRYEYFHGKDWHRTREEAVDQAEKMRINKVASLKKSLVKMENLKF